MIVRVISESGLRAPMSQGIDTAREVASSDGTASGPTGDDPVGPDEEHSPLPDSHHSRGRGGGGFFEILHRPRSGDDRARVDLRNTWQVVVGSVLLPLGVVFILMAWYGAAHTRYVQQQIPYLVSGSFVGLGCMVVGGLLYWAHWLYRIYDQADQHHDEQLEVMQRAFRALAEQGYVERGAVAPSARPVSSAVSLAPPPVFRLSLCQSASIPGPAY